MPNPETFDGINPRGTETLIPCKDATARSGIEAINDKIPSAASSDNKLVDTTAMNDAIGSALASAYKPAGNKTVAELTSSLLVAANVGKVYNMTDAGTTTADFMEGAGKPIRIGDDVGICEPTSGTYKFNLVSGFISIDTNPTAGSANPVSSGGVETALSGKVDKVNGKGLSTNDYNNTAKGIVDTAQDNIIANTKLIKDTVGWSGKNKLIPLGRLSVTGDITATINSDGTITINGTPQSGTAFVTLYDETDPAQKPINWEDKIYTLSGCPAGGGSDFGSGYHLDIVSLNHGTIFPNTFDNGNGVNFNGANLIGLNDACIRIRVAQGTTVSNLTFKPMIREADILDPTYEPYFGSTAFPRSEQAVLGAKNRLPNNVISQTLYDVVWTKNADDSLTANGTADANNNSIITVFGPVTGAYLKSLLGSNVTYKMSGCPSGGSSSTYYFRCYKVSPWTIIADNFGDAETTLNTSVFEDNAQYNFVCAVNRGIQADNFVFKPMLSLDGGAYVPYAMTNRELTEAVLNGFSDANVIGRANANQTWATQLTALNTKWGSLTDNQKHNAKVYAGGKIYRCSNIDTGAFESMTGALIDNKPTIVSGVIRLDNQVAYDLYLNADGNSITNRSNENNSSSLLLLSGI